MKLLYMFLLTLMFQGGYDHLMSAFPEAKYDEFGNLLTRELNRKNISDLKEECLLVPDDLSFKYLCDGDSSNFQYTYALYDMDKDEVTGYVKEIYKHFAVTSVTEINFDLVLYSKFDNRAERYILRSFDKVGNKIDELVVNEEIRRFTGASLDKFSFSLINPDSIKVFNYNDAPNPNSEDEKAPLITKVIIEDYAIDSVGRFNKVAVDSVILSKSLRAYTKFNNEPETDDPVYKYWTLW